MGISNVQKPVVLTVGVLLSITVPAISAEVNSQAVGLLASSVRNYVKSCLMLCRKAVRKELLLPNGGRVNRGYKVTVVTDAVMRAARWMEL